MKLSDWAKKQGISYLTAYRWFKSDKLPVSSYQSATGTIIVNDKQEVNQQKQRNVIYCRVSNHSRKEEIQYQIDRCQQFALAQGLSIDKIYKEIASGMNDNRKIFWQMLDSNPTNIIIENKDRLTRFGFLYLEKLLLKQETNIIVINKDFINETDLIKDLVAIITSFCCRLYGARRGKNKSKEIKEILNDQVNST